MKKNTYIVDPMMFNEIIFHNEDFLNSFTHDVCL